jgi:hypothetical protein
MNSNNASDFIIKFDFNKDSRKSSHVFRIMSEILDSFNILDRAFISTINSKLEPIIMLEDIEKGSLLTRLKYILDVVPDSAIENLDWKKLVGYFLIKAKYIIIDFINKRESICSSTEIELLEYELTQLSENIQHNELTIPGSIDRPKLLTGISKISDAIAQIEENEEVTYMVDNNEIAFNLSFSFNASQIEDLLTVETITSTSEMILKIKKPDYLGDSKWEFRHRKEAINANITDNEWIAKFRNREITLKPGDSIRASVNIEVKYDYDREVSAINYNITKVLEVIYSKPNVQNNLFND